MANKRKTPVLAPSIPRADPLPAGMPATGVPAPDAVEPERRRTKNAQPRPMRKFHHEQRKRQD